MAWHSEIVFYGDCQYALPMAFYCHEKDTTNANTLTINRLVQITDQKCKKQNRLQDKKWKITLGDLSNLQYFPLFSYIIDNPVSLTVSEWTNRAGLASVELSAASIWSPRSVFTRSMTAFITNEWPNRRKMVSMIRRNNIFLWKCTKIKSVI